MKKLRLTIIATLLFSTIGFVRAQYQPNVIRTAPSILNYTPDARASAMGGCGVATEADAFSMFYNPAKYAFMKNDHTMIASGFDLWTRSFVKLPISLYGTFAQKIGKSAIASSLRYYGGDDIEFRDEYNQQILIYSPREFVADIAYSYRFGEYLSAGIASRFIYSSLTREASDYIRPGMSFAADLGVYYNRPLGSVVDLSLGASVTNIGTKMNYNVYSDRKEFLPTTMRLGTGFKFAFHPKHSLTLNLQFSKLLVPTPPIRDYEGDVVYGYEDNVSVFRGMIQSFYDAPGWVYNYDMDQYESIGTFYEELCEINTGVGLEYNLADHFFVRNGYFHRSALKGGGDYFATGLGMHFGIFGMDVSYNFPVSTAVGYNSYSNIFRWNMYFAF